MTCILNTWIILVTTCVGSCKLATRQGRTQAWWNPILQPGMKCAHEYPQIPYCLFTGAGGATDLTPGQLSRQFKQGARLASSAIQVRPSKSKHLAWVQRQKTHATDEIARFREWVAAREFKESFAPFCHAYVSLAKKSVGISYTQLHNRSMSSFFHPLSLLQY